MNLRYVPLLHTQRDLHALPRNHHRFKEYLVTIGARGSPQLKLPSLVLMNPMGKEHMATLLDALLEMQADEIAAEAVVEAAARLKDEPGDYKVALVVADDLMGGWTNRYANEFSLRFPKGPSEPGERALPKWLKELWITAVQWSSEAPSAKGIREAVLTAVYRTAYQHQHGCPITLRAMLAQEGAVLARTGCTSPDLDSEEIEYTREVIKPYLEADDMRTAIECLFGDAAGLTLGFTPRGLSPWAGIALALHDAKTKIANQ